MTSYQAEAVRRHRPARDRDDRAGLEGAQLRRVRVGAAAVRQAVGDHAPESAGRQRWRGIPGRAHVPRARVALAVDRPGRGTRSRGRPPPATRRTLRGSPAATWPTVHRPPRPGRRTRPRRWCRARPTRRRTPRRPGSPPASGYPPVGPTCRRGTTPTPRGTARSGRRRTREPTSRRPEPVVVDDRVALLERREVVVVDLPPAGDAAGGRRAVPAPVGHVRAPLEGIPPAAVLGHQRGDVLVVHCGAVAVLGAAERLRARGRVGGRPRPAVPREAEDDPARADAGRVRANGVGEVVGGARHRVDRPGDAGP